ncbi:MAG: DNA N-6-adenine-methyltransferase, partial [Nanoarchaeota archaeon]
EDEGETEGGDDYFEEDDGLSKPWFFNVWLNPPYSDLDKWLEKMSIHKQGIVLCFCRTETKAYQKYVKTATGINLMAKRVSFLNSEGEAKNKYGKKSNGNAPSCLIAWGELNYERIKKVDGIYLRIDNSTDA